MSRRGATPTYLGGIGLMLEVARICPRCGQRLADSPSASAWHLEGNRCRPAVYMALPEPPVREEEVPPTPATRRIHDFEAPLARDPSGRRLGWEAPAPLALEPARALAASWLRPPDLGEVF